MLAGVSIAMIVGLVAVAMNAAIHSRNRELHGLSNRQKFKLAAAWVAIFSIAAAVASYFQN